MKYLQLVLVPLLLFIYSFVMDKSAQNFQDLVAVIYGMLGVAGSIISLVLYFLLKKYIKEDKWYINIIFGIAGIIIAFVLIMIYSRLNISTGQPTDAVSMILR